MNTLDLTLGVYRLQYAGFLKGRRINAVSLGAEALFWRLHAIADDFGNFHADPETLRSDAFPKRKIGPAAVKALFDELLGSGTEESPALVTTYTVRGEVYGHISNFKELQPAGKNGRRIRRVPGESGCVLGEPGGLGKSKPSDYGNGNGSDTEKNEDNTRAREAKTRLVWTEANGWSGLTDEHRTRWAAAFPSCNLHTEMAKADSWLRANPDKKKKNHERFLHNWLTRSQERGGVNAGGERANPGVPPRSAPRGGPNLNGGGDGLYPVDTRPLPVVR